MYALKLVGLVVLAGLSVTGFILGYNQFQEWQTQLEAEDLVREIDSEVSSNFFLSDYENFKMEGMRVPEGYVLSFRENHIEINGFERELENPKESSYEYEDFNSGVYDFLFTVERKDEAPDLVRVEEV